MDQSALIDQIYDCALDVTAWPEVLERIARDIGAHKAVLCCNNQDTLIWAAPVGLGADYIDHVYRLREIDDFHAMRSRLPTGRALLSHELIPLEQFRKSPFYKEWGAPLGCVHIAGGLLILDDDEWTALRFFRPEDAPVFEPEVKEQLDALLPHMARSARISRRLGAAEQRIKRYEHVFGLLSSGLILLNDKLQIVFQNRLAETMLAANDPLTVIKGEPVPRDRRSQKGFRKLLKSALETEQAGFRGGAQLLHYVDMEKRPIQAWIAPLCVSEPGFEWAGDGAQIACFFVDPSKKAPLPADLLASLYDLTPREAALVHDLLRGETLSQIAASKHKSLNTLKTHLRSVFSKTDTNRQNELVTLIQPVIELRAG